MWGWHKGESVPVTVGLAHRLVAIKKSKKQQFQKEFLQEVSLGAKIRFYFLLLIGPTASHCHLTLNHLVVMKQ
jgi:hypothetical protein